MSSSSTISLQLDRRILEHPRAYHLRRMREGLWLYLDLLARLPAGADTLEVEPVVVGRDMGLQEGTVRSWLGHLRKAGYVEAARLNGIVRVTIKKGFVPEPVESQPERYFTVARLQRSLKDKLNMDAFEAALQRYPDPVIQRALAGVLAPPDEQIRRSRTALFLYLLSHNRHASKS